ncbi:MAG TPA: DUF1080 domain-containing protein [Bryobacterales bacterium]|nr:DUF1080 domain-containing protein [Bryobacterales bacterium]
MSISRYTVLLLLGSALAMAAPPAKIEIPHSGKAIKLFNGKNLDGFDTFLRTKGLNNDPEKVFQVENGMIHISGAEFGYLITQKEYDNYYLRAEFKWGEGTHAPRAGKARDSGILYHVNGENKVWPQSIEFQMIEGGTGDIILVDGAALTVKGVHKEKGRFDRFGKGPWKDVAGFRDPVGEVEKPHGEWNVLELIADGDSVRYLVNGKLANEGIGSNLTRGKILFQSEGAEVWFRNLELRPLKKR